MSCEKCRGQGYVETERGNVVCTCKVTESIKVALSEFPNVMLAPNRKISPESFPENCVINISKKDSMFSVIKTMFTYFYIKGIVHSLYMVDSDTVMDAYFDKSTHYTIDEMKVQDFLIIQIEEGKINKILPDVLKSIVTYRKDILCKPTWIWFSSFNGNKIKDNFNFSELMTYLDNSGFTFRTIK